MASQTQGIQQLLGAEKRAAEKVKTFLKRTKVKNRGNVSNFPGEWGQEEEEQEAEAGKGGGEKVPFFYQFRFLWNVI